MASRLNSGKRFKSEGKCVGCQEKYSPIKGKNHVLKCADVLRILSSEPNLEEGYLVHVSCAYKPNIYWMLTAVPKSLTLNDLDEFLRSTWLECCGHLSEFYIGGRRYASFSDADDFFNETVSSSESDGDDSSDKDKSAFQKKVGKVLSPGLKFKYTYDMGSSTDLILEVLQTIQTSPLQEVTLLMQNDPPPFNCENCEKQAETICSYCQETTCNDCKKEHSCAQDENGTEMMLPLVNSPRAGVCGYNG